MKTIKDIYDIVAYEYFPRGTCNTYGHLYCDTCPQYFTWCHVDSYVLAMDYLSKGVYYG